MIDVARKRKPPEIGSSETTQVVPCPSKDDEARALAFCRDWINDDLTPEDQQIMELQALLAAGLAEVKAQRDALQEALHRYAVHQVVYTDGGAVSGYRCAICGGREPDNLWGRKHVVHGPRCILAEKIADDQ